MSKRSRRLWNRLEQQKKEFVKLEEEQKKEFDAKLAKLEEKLNEQAVVLS